MKIKTNYCQSSYNEEQAKKNLENAIVSCPENLEKVEVDALSWRFGLFGRQNHEISNLAIRLRKQIPEVRKILKISSHKCLSKPIQDLLKEADLRVQRFHNHKGKDGKADLDVACKILKRADLLNDCRIAFGIQ